MKLTTDDEALYRMHEALSQYAGMEKNWDAFFQGISGQVKFYRKLKKPGLEQLLTILGGLEFQAGSYDSAILHLEEAVKLIQNESGNNSEKLVLSIELIGASYFETKNYPKASEIFNNVIALSFKNTNSKDLYLSNLYLGKIKEAQGNNTKAAQFFEKAATALSIKVPTNNPYEILNRDNMKYLVNKKLEKFRTGK